MKNRLSSGVKNMRNVLKQKGKLLLLKQEIWQHIQGTIQEPQATVLQNISKKIEFDKDTGEIITASSTLDINEELIKQEEALDGYYMLVTSEMETTDDEVIEMYRGLWKIEESFKVNQKRIRRQRPVYVWTKEHIEAHFLT